MYVTGCVEAMEEGTEVAALDQREGNRNLNTCDILKHTGSRTC